ncbi:MAG: undecaprenyl-diphosphate phosphatase [[Eubacterium] siraeum]
MDYISIIIQGIIQGLTEFLPVSSSGHLSVAQHFMNIGENNPYNFVLHLERFWRFCVVFFPTIWE